MTGVPTIKLGRITWVAAATLSLLLIAGPAFAHVTIETADPAPEAVARYVMRVPNESDIADTVKIEVQLPEGFGVERTPRPKGWNVSISDGVLTLSGGRIPPGDFKEFVFRMQNPARTGDVAIPVIQTYSDGVEAAWIGEPESDHPAPVVTIAGKPDPPREQRPAETPAQNPTEPPSETTEPPSEPTEPVPNAPEATESLAQPSAGPSDPPEAEPNSTLPTAAIAAGLVGIALALGAYALGRRGRTG